MFLYLINYLDLVNLIRMPIFFFFNIDIVESFILPHVLLKNDFKNDQIKYYNYNDPYPYQSKKIFFIFKGIPFFYKLPPVFLPPNKISCFFFTNKMFYNYDYDFINISSFNDFKSKPSMTLYSNPLFLRAKKEFINSFFFLGENEPPFLRTNEPPFLRINDPQLLRTMLY